MPSPPTAQRSVARLAGGRGCAGEELLASEPALPPEPELLGGELPCPALPGAAPPPDELIGRLVCAGIAGLVAVPPWLEGLPGESGAGPGSAEEPPVPPDAAAAISEPGADTTPGERSSTLQAASAVVATSQTHLPGG